MGIGMDKTHLELDNPPNLHAHFFSSTLPGWLSLGRCFLHLRNKNIEIKQCKTANIPQLTPSWANMLMTWADISGLLNYHFIPVSLCLIRTEQGCCPSSHTSSPFAWLERFREEGRIRARMFWLLYKRHQIRRRNYNIVRALPATLYFIIIIFIKVYFLSFL